MSLIKINSIEMPPPTAGGYTVTLQDLDSENTTRSETGILNRDRIRAGVYKIACKWFVNTKDLEKIMSAIKDEQFNVTFYFGGNYITAKMYAGDKTNSLVTHKDGFDWWDVSCNFTQY